MIESKAWNWEIVPKDEPYWNMPSEEIYYLSENWKNKGFHDFLDIGCGLGKNSIFMAKAGYRVFAFDLSKEAVKVTRQKFEQEKLNIEKLEVADMLSIPYPDEKFDCILARNVISHTDKEGFDKIMSEIKRVLRPGGEVYFTVGSKESYWFNNPACKYVDDYTRIRVEDGPENGIPHFYIGDEDCKTLFNDFKIISIRHIRELTMHGTFSPHYYIWLKK